MYSPQENGARREVIAHAAREARATRRGVSLVSASSRLLVAAAASAAAAAAILSAGVPVTAASAATTGRAAIATAAARAGRAAPAARPGRVGRTMTLTSGADLHGYDAATDAAGNTYIGWIAAHGSAANRTVFLCTIPHGGTACAGGIRSTPSLGGSSADGLRVLVGGGKVSLVWSHETTASVNGPNGDEIAVATRQPNGSLSAPADMATAPSFGTLLDAALGPQNSIWAISQPGGATPRIVLRPGLASAAVTLKTPYLVGGGRIAFSGATAVLAVQKAGAISVPVAYAVHRGSWSGFRKLARTWTSDANLGLVRTRSGIRLLASVANASYWPVVSRFTGSSFTRPQLTGDRTNCFPGSHDPVADASGRMTDVSEECATKVAIANLSDTLHAVVVRFPSGGTFAGGIPQIATTPRGRGWVVWSIEGKVSDKLLAARVLLPGRLRTVAKSAAGNRARLTGPASCLPPVSVRARVAGSPARHWHVVSRRLLLSGKAHGATINGAALAAGRTYTLSGRVTFARGGSRRVVTAVLKFRTCPNP
jgi:hypothetical protein